MSSKICSYSIVKVSGLSMAPFFKSNDVLLLEMGHHLNSQNLGLCYLIENNIHRLIATNSYKGDRLIYYDKVNSLPTAIVVGKIVEKNQKKYLTNHLNPFLLFISKLIAVLSRFNLEKSTLRLPSLILIIVLGSSHRFLENLTLKEFQS